ncbi:MAG: AAA family ATPase [Leptospiraceae bacterium]|nr:AAA family ATPase [Leptospiraceae bacterium]
MIKQTHASFIFITKPFVYKVKKPVNYGFLDYSTLDKRFFYLSEELRLNKRFCPELYINVVLLHYDHNSHKLEFLDVYSKEEIENLDNLQPMHKFHELKNKFQNQKIEFALKMYYVEEKDFLRNQVIHYQKLNKITERLIEIYQTLPRAPKNPQKEIIFQNLDDCSSFVNYTITPIAFRIIKRFNLLYFRKFYSLLRKRELDGWVKECHGDLHIEHIIIQNGKVCIFDCIEFNPDFRYIDIASDIAFFCMDLEFLGYYRESYYFIKNIYKFFHNYEIILLQDLYRCYRAFVRGKVYTLKSLHKDINQTEKEEAISLAKKYFQLSLSYALKNIHPTVFVFMGRIGSGKSTLARKLAELLGTRVFSSDEIRKELFYLDKFKRTPEEEKQKLYNRLITQVVYNKMIRDGIDQALKKGVSVLDATFATRKLRNMVLFATFEENVQCWFIEVDTKKEIIIERLKKRENSENEISDAGVKEFLDFYDLYEPPYEIPQKQKITLKLRKERSIDNVFSFLLKKILIHRFQYREPY